jgi:predicted DNA-binding transcriptional regulator AlpA
MQEEKYLTGPQVLTRYHISEMTLHRWQKDDKLDFPKPMIVRRRKFFLEAELTAWERHRAGRVSA